MNIRWRIKDVRENHTALLTDETSVVTLPRTQAILLVNLLYKKHILKNSFDSALWGKRYKQIYLSPSQSVVVPEFYQALLDFRRRQEDKDE